MTFTTSKTVINEENEQITTSEWFEDCPICGERTEGYDILSWSKPQDSKREVTREGCNH